MNGKSTLCLCLVGTLLAAPLGAIADVDKESIFRDARTAVSELDLLLVGIQKDWWNRYVTSPDDKAREEYPLITKSGMGITLDYFGNDRISATGVISDIDGFLKLSVAERKQLVSNTLALVQQRLSWPAVTLVDKATSQMTGESIENHDIELNVLFNHVTHNDKGGNIRIFMPNEMGVGSAGYKDGQFIFSEAYFLNLKVHDGVAVSGSPSNYSIEHE